MHPIRTVVLGLGRSGWNIHCNALAGRSDYQVVGVVDPLPERREEARQRFGCETDDDPERLIRRLQPDLVVVATPSHTHAAYSIMALRAGCHVLCEKPMARSAAEADAMIAAARESGRILTVFQNSRFLPWFTTLQRLLAEGRIGEPILIKIRYQQYLRRRDWQMLRSHNGGMLYNTGPHPVDQALLLLGGEPEQVFCDMQHTVSAGDADDHVKLVLKRGRLTIDLEMTQIATFNDPPVVVFGLYGGIWTDHKVMKVRWYDPKAVPPPELWEGPAPGRQYNQPEDLPWQEEEIVLPQVNTATLYYDRLARTLLHGEPLFVTPEQVRLQMALFDRCKELNGIPIEVN